jgi:hypothetical protein
LASIIIGWKVPQSIFHLFLLRALQIRKERTTWRSKAAFVHLLTFNQAPFVGSGHDADSDKLLEAAPMLD